jgi:hypothetical protein
VSTSRAKRRRAAERLSLKWIDQFGADAAEAAFFEAMRTAPLRLRLKIALALIRRQR